MNRPALRQRLRRPEAKIQPPKLELYIVYVDYLHDPPDPDIWIPVDYEPPIRTH